jgi:hypothetical protein
MADDAALSFLNDRENFLARYRSQTLPTLDLSGENISFDFSGLTLRSWNFSNCKLHGSRFLNSELHNCNFESSDWTACDFSGTTFNGCNLSNIKNAHLAVGLDAVRGNGILMNFETAERPWRNKWLDWEHIGVLGRLPLFTASTTALVILPIYFYVLDIYNQHIEAWRAALARHAEDEAFATVAKQALDKFGHLPIPSLSLAALISAILLFIASVLYAWRCPARIKQFSNEQWRFELKYPMLTYWPFAWKHPKSRMICAASYLIGGGLALFIVGVKFYETWIYIWRNM